MYEAGESHPPKEMPVVSVEDTVISRLTNYIFERAFALGVRDANRTGKGVHRVKDKLTGANALITGLLDRVCEAFFPSVLAQRDFTIAKTRHYLIVFIEAES